MDSACKSLANLRFSREVLIITTEESIIDPANTNPRAAHVYKKAGFVAVDEFVPASGSFKGIPHRVMKLKLSNYDKPSLDR